MNKRARDVLDQTERLYRQIVQEKTGTPASAPSSALVRSFLKAIEDVDSAEIPAMFSHAAENMSGLAPMVAAYAVLIAREMDFGESDQLKLATAGLFSSVPILTLMRSQTIPYSACEILVQVRENSLQLRSLARVLRVAEDFVKLRSGGLPLPGALTLMRNSGIFYGEALASLARILMAEDDRRAGTA